MEDDKITPEAARAVLNAEKTNREAACMIEIQAALDKYRCDLAGAPAFTADGRVTVQVRVTARPG